MADLRVFIDSCGNQMIFDDSLQQVEPEEGKLRQHCTLAGDGLVHDDIIGRDTVSGNHEEFVGMSGDLVHIPNFPPMFEYEIGEICR